MKNKKNNRSYIPGVFALFGMPIGSSIGRNFFSHPWRASIGMFGGLIVGFLLGKLINYSIYKKQS